MNVLGLITARGGSKGIPRKNVAACGGKPLIGWTCEAAGAARCLTRTILSTDDPEIAACAESFGVPSPFLRPPALASDTARSIDVAMHAVRWLRENEAFATDVLVLLQPTSPLRRGHHIDEAYARLSEDVDSVVSVVEVPHRFKPWSVLRDEGGILRDFVEGTLPFDRYRRQGQPTLYARNGPAVVVSRAVVLAQGVFYGPRTAAYVMSPEDSVDIDELEDLAYADWVIRRKGEAL